VSTPDARAIAVAARLRAALERLAAALTRPDADTILACEVDIESVLGDLYALARPSLPAVSAETRTMLRAELMKASSALLRCRRLGTALGDYVRITLEAQGHQSGYGPRAAAPDFAGHSLNTRA
jgi:hypothetical protein